MGLLWHSFQYLVFGVLPQWHDSLQYSMEPDRHLRGLSGETAGGINFVDVSFVMICIICAGLASGLTQGLLSLDLMEMEIKARSGTPEEKMYAAKLIPIISHHHLLLVTLMLWNASATEALPIFLTALVPEYLAIIISVTLVLFVGEIIPASILTGPSQLKISASLTPLVYLVLFVFFPIAYPISYALDYFIGHDEGMTMYNRKEISTMMRLQREEGVKRAQMHSKSRATSKAASTSALHSESLFEEEEVTIIDGALKFREMAVSEVMTPADNVYMISVTEKLDYKLIYEIFKSGHSRIPVYEKDRNDIVGLILAKDLIFIDPEDETSVRNFMDLFGRKPAVVWHDSKLGETLSMFRQEKSHMAIVRDVECDGEGDPYYQVVGIITLEDIVEEILGAEIEDETDVQMGPDGVVSNYYRDSIMMQPYPVRDPELARLRTMTNASVQQDGLTEEEVHSIGIFLFTNVPQVQRMFSENMAGLQTLVRTSAVISLTRSTQPGEIPRQEDFLYRKGRLTNTCALILSGSVEVFDEGNASVSPGGGEEAVPGRGLDQPQPPQGRIKGPWSTLAPEALEAEEATHITDFNAVVYSENLRYLRLSKFTPPSMEEGKSGKGGGLERTYSEKVPSKGAMGAHPLRKMRTLGATLGSRDGDDDDLSSGNFTTHSNNSYYGRRAISKEERTGVRTVSTGGGGVRLRRDKSTDRDFDAAALYGFKGRKSVDVVPQSDARESLGGSVAGQNSRAGSLSQPLQSILGGFSLTRSSAANATSAATFDATTNVGADSGDMSSQSSPSVRNPLQTQRPRYRENDEKGYVPPRPVPGTVPAKPSKRGNESSALLSAPGGSSSNNNNNRSTNSSNSSSASTGSDHERL